MKRENIILICSSLLIILWIYAAGSKLTSYDNFLFSLNRQPLPHWSIPFIAIAIPAIELVTVGLLALDKGRTLGFLLSLLLMTSFTLYVALALTGAFGEIPCSCGGIISELKWKGHLIFNMFFTAIAWIGWRKNRIKNQSTHLNSQLV